MPPFAIRVNPTNQFYHFKSIDQLRGLAALMIVFHHLHHPSLQFDWLPLNLRQSWTGVHIFFVISGFVVGTSLLNQLSYQSEKFFARIRDNRQLILDFFKRRFYRLAPSAVTVLVLIAIMFVIFEFEEPVGLTLSQRLTEIGRALIEYLIPTYNTHIVFSGFKIPNRLTTAPYWSLTIENQFYLLLPFFILFTPNRRHLIASSLGVFAVVSFLIRPAFKLFYPEDNSDVINIYYANSLTNFDGLFLGVALAGLFSNTTLKNPLKQRAGLWIILTFVFAWIYPNLWGSGTDRGRNIMSVYTLTILATGYMVWRCAQEELLLGKLPFKGKTLNSILDYLGSRSYVLYLLHMPIAKLTKQGLGFSGWILSGGYWLILFLVVELLHRFIEKHYQRKRNCTVAVTQF